MLDPPREGAVDLDLKIPRASYSPRRCRVARRREKKFNRPRVVQNSDQIHPAFSRTRVDFPKPPQPIVVFAPNVGSRREYCVVEAVNSLCACGASVAGRQHARLCSEKAHVVPHQRAFGGKVGWFGGVGPGCRPNNAQCRFESVGGPCPAPRIVQRVPFNASCPAP